MREAEHSISRSAIILPLTCRQGPHKLIKNGIKHHNFTCSQQGKAPLSKPCHGRAGPSLPAEAQKDTQS